MTHPSENWTDVTRDKYDELNGKWHTIGLRRERFTKAIDKQVARLLVGADRWLDIGTGDGLRVSRLAEHASGQLVVVENSSLLPEDFDVPGIETKVLRKPIEEADFDTLGKFQVVSLLWNVLGHLQDPQAVLKQICPGVSDGGTVVGDVNNYLNVRQYGMMKVLRNVVLGYSKPRQFQTSIAEGRAISVWLFSPFAVRRLLRKAGFGSTSIRFFDYDSGELASIFSGQIYFEAKKP